jgi:lysophospholipase L1-like esterase
MTIAALSWRFIEDPIRHGAIGRLWAQRRSLLRRSSVRGWRPAVIMTVSVATLTTACVGMTSSPASPAATTGHARTSSSPSANPAPSTTTATSSAPKSTKSAKPAPAASSSPVTTLAKTTSCTSVVHIGDSTSEGMVSPDYLPNPAQRLPAQYARVGITTTRLEISGGTSLLETVDPGQANAYEVAQQLLRSGYHGCWVLALGTNDTADVYVGSAENRAVRIAKMMTLLAGQPVMWLTVKSLQASGPYSETNMKLWNNALVADCSKYPNMRIFDWAGLMQSRWFSSDGIHFTSAGYAERAALIANAVAHSFPAHGSSSTCVVH